MIRIRDPLHGTIQLSEAEEALLDTPQMQRLRGVRQLAMAYLVYPGANHTRFEHSLGTLYLADRMCRELGVDEDDAIQVRLAALLHDIGHPAFSHEAEAVLSSYIGSHEKAGEQIIQGSSIKDILSRSFSPKKIASLYHSPLGQLITSDVGADRMDYLLRDSHYTGVAYGVIDADRICSTVALDSRGLYVTERGLAAAESLLVARFTMFSSVYLHKTVRIASRMLQQAIRLAIDDKALDPKSALQMTDWQLLSCLLESPAARELALRLSQRRLYKKAFACPAVHAKGRQRNIERELSEKCGCSVLIDVPALSLKASIRLQSGKGKRPISSFSQLIASLEKMQESRLEALVICDEKHVEKVEREAKKLLQAK